MKRFFLSIIVFLSIAPYCGAQNILPSVNKKGLWGYANENGKYVIKPIYQSAETFSSDLACVKINDVYGYINRMGEFVIAPSFEYAESFKGNIAKCKINNRYGFINTSGTPVVDFEYSEIHPSNNKQFFIGKKAGDTSFYVISLSSQEAKINRFDSISTESENGFFTVKSNGKIGYIRLNGEIVVEPVFLDNLSFSTSGLAVSHKESGFGIVNRDFQTIIPENYSYVRTLNNGNYYYGNSEKSFGLISADGKCIFPEGKYSVTKILADKNYVVAKESDRTYIVDYNGEAIVEDCDSYSIAGGIITYTIGKSTHKLNTSSGARSILLDGKDIWTKCKASSIKFEDPFVMWTDTIGNEHAMTSDGLTVFGECSNVHHFSRNVFLVEKDGKHAVANVSGKILSEWVDGIFPIDEEYLLLAKRGSSARMICAIMRACNARMVTGWDFTYIDLPLKNGVISVKLLKGDNLCRTEKKIKLAGDSFFIVEDLSEGMYPIIDNTTKKMGVMTEDGKILVYPKYDQVGEFKCGMCRVWIVEKGNGFINKSGQLVIPCQYPKALDFGTIKGVANYTQVWDNCGDTYYIDKKGNPVDSELIMREAYDTQRRDSWYQ